MEETKTKKSGLNILITSNDVMDYEYKTEAIDLLIYLKDIFKVKPID